MLYSLLYAFRQVLFVVVAGSRQAIPAARYIRQSVLAQTCRAPIF